MAVNERFTPVVARREEERWYRGEDLVRSCPQGARPIGELLTAWLLEEATSRRRA